jgi:hypothetical protein
VPPLPLLVAPEVFDAFGWCPSTELEWRTREPFRHDTPVDGSDPQRMVFVFHADAGGGAAGFLPRELARIHAVGLGLDDEWALAPYAIDDATDGLFERGIVPAHALWLAADNLNALFWGLHDWAHFHNHGPFERRAENELQCDAAALAWTWRNRATIPIGEDAWEKLREEVAALARGRFDEEQRAWDAGVLASDRLRALLPNAER